MLVSGPSSQKGRDPGAFCPFREPRKYGKVEKKHSINILLMPPPLVRVRSGRLGVVVKAVFPGCNYSRRNTLQSKTAQLLDHWLDRNRRSKFRLAGMAGQMFSAVVLWSGRAGSCRDNQGFRHGRSAGDAQLGQRGELHRGVEDFSGRYSHDPCSTYEKPFCTFFANTNTSEINATHC